MFCYVLAVSVFRFLAWSRDVWERYVERGFEVLGHEDNSEDLARPPRPRAETTGA